MHVANVCCFAQRTMASSCLIFFLKKLEIQKGGTKPPTR
jgi:hypothetical protein